MGLDAVRRPRPDAQLLHLCQVTTDAESAGYNDANWCSDEYDKLYEQQNQELDRDKRVELGAPDAARCSTTRAPYVVLYHDADTQAYRTDRFEGWVRQPQGHRPGAVQQHVADLLSLAPIGEGSGTTDSTAPGSTDGSTGTWPCDATMAVATTAATPV